MSKPAKPDDTQKYGVSVPDHIWTSTEIINDIWGYEWRRPVHSFYEPTTWAQILIIVTFILCPVICARYYNDTYFTRNS